MKDLKTDSLRVDCLLSKPVSYNWGREGEYGGPAWSVVQPFDEDDFGFEICPICEGTGGAGNSLCPSCEGYGGKKEVDEENERKTGYKMYSELEESNQPMMDYYYPLPDGHHSPEAVVGLPLCMVYFEDMGEYALALTGGGMDLSWPICEAHIRLGYYPPIHFRLPRMAGKERSARNLAIVEACVAGREIVKKWQDADIADLGRTRDFLSPLVPKYDKERMKMEKEGSLWDIGIPGRDCREGELRMVPDEIKEVLNTELLDKFMHMGVFAYSASSYLVDVLESLYYVEDEEKRDRLARICFNRVVQDIIFGADGKGVNAWTEEEEHLNHMIEWITGVFEEARQT